MGGLEHYKQLADQRSQILWRFIDSSDGYYKSKITDKKYRSKVNVVFRILDGNTEIEETFINCAKKIGIV